MREAFQLRDIPKDSMDLMFASLRSSSWKQYECALRKWWKFCNRKNLSPYDASVKNVITCLTEEYYNGASHGSLNSLRSAVSLIVGPHIGQDQSVKRLFKGVMELRPSAPKYDQTWDPKIVLDHFNSLGNNSNLSLETLSSKLATLLALVIGHRMQTLALIKLKNIEDRQNAIHIKISDSVKTSGRNKKQPLLVLPTYEKDKNICVKTTLEEYVERTKSLRGSNDLLFIAFKKPHKAVTPQTLSRWVKNVLLQSGLDTKIFSAHSTRHASTSAAKRKRVSIDVIKNTAGWTSNSQTFAKFYDRPIVTDKEIFARAILDN